MVGIVTRLPAGRSGVRVPVGARELLFSKTFKRTMVPTNPPIQSVPGLFPGGKVSGA